MSKIELLLHPIRIRILTSLVGKQLTPAQIAEEMPDVAQTTLYRQINALVEGGILTVVEERPVRGTVEKVYALVDGAARLNQDDISSVSDEDHLRYFVVFLSSLLQDFSTFLEKRKDVQEPTDKVVYSKVRVSLTDDEWYALSNQIRALTEPYVKVSDEADRKSYLFTLISIPED
jgi:DNA-binding transcriptional ArsR family regulator